MGRGGGVSRVRRVNKTRRPGARGVRVAVCRPQVPFARGGAEIFADELIRELHARGHEADLVMVPFKWYPGQRVLTQAFLWRLLDLDEADGRPIDLVVATKFPSYAVRHPNKVVWLVHQFRQAYELDRTPLGQFGESPQELAYRCDGYGDFVLSVGRLDRAKRIDLLIEAARRAAIDVVVAGDGPDRARPE